MGNESGAVCMMMDTEPAGEEVEMVVYPAEVEVA